MAPTLFIFAFNSQLYLLPQWDTCTIEVYLAGSDMETEGLWTTWYDRTLIQYLPWGSGSPITEGANYNCMMLKNKMRDTGHPHFVPETSFVYDMLCSAKFCPVCLVDMDVRKMTLRKKHRNPVVSMGILRKITICGTISFILRI